MFSQLTSLLTGSAAGQVLGFFFIAALTYAYQPAALGEYQLCFSAAVFLSIVLTLKLEIAIPTLPSGDVLPHILAIFWLITGQTALLLVLTGLADWFDIFDALGLQIFESGTAILLTFAIAILLALNGVARFVLIQQKAFNSIALTLFIQSGGRGAFQYALQIMQQFGLLLGDIVARSLMLLIAYFGFRKIQYNDNLKVNFVASEFQPIERGSVTNDTKRSLRSTLAPHWRYPVWVVPSTILNNAMGLLLIPLIAFKYGLEEAGIAAVSYRVLTAPNSLLGAALADILFSRFSDYAKNADFEKILHEFLLASVGLVSISAIGFGSLYIMADYLPFVLDTSYEKVGVYVQLLLPWFAVQLVASPLSRVIFVFDKQAYKLVFDIASVSTLLVFTFFIDEQSILGFLTDLANVMATLYFLYYIGLAMIVLLQRRAPYR
jgi:O-antigen/teichoic acid export membrane protein